MAKQNLPFLLCRYMERFVLIQQTGLIILFLWNAPDFNNVARVFISAAINYTLFKGTKDCQDHR